MLYQDSYVYQLQDGYLSPIVFARLESPTSNTKLSLFALIFSTQAPFVLSFSPRLFSEGVMISIECRAYDQFIRHNSQEAIGLVHFEVSEK